MRKLSQISGIFAALLIIMLSLTASVSAEAVYIEDTGFVIEPPVGWDVMDVTESRWTFNDFTGDAFIQIKIWPGEEYDTPEALYKGVYESIGAEGEGEAFDLYGREAVFGVIDFNSGGFDYSGYAMLAEGDDFDLAILSFASTESIGKLNDYILSALDSFALSPVLMLNPGPVSSYYLQSYGGPQRINTATVFEDEAVDWAVDERAIEASQLVIEREAAILADYKPDTEEGIEAWKRYYRMIYRDNYSRLDYPAALMKERLTDKAPVENDRNSWFSIESAKSNLTDAPSRLLTWVQEFNYLRTAGSDLISPLSAAAFQEGDCDSRALLYIILLNHYGIDSALMVSAEYSHAMAAVDTEGPGARIDFNGRALLVGETTDDVALGMIASDMADPAKWIVIPLMEKEPWN